MFWLMSLDKHVFYNTFVIHFSYADQTFPRLKAKQQSLDILITVWAYFDESFW